MNKNLSLSLAATLLCSGAFAAEPFTVDHMWSMQRLGAPSASPDGRLVAFTVSKTDMAANKSLTDLWVQDTAGKTTARRLTTHDASESSPQWSADGKHLYFLSSRSGSNQLWRIAIDGGEATQVSDYPISITSYQLSPEPFE